MNFMSNLFLCILYIIDPIIWYKSMSKLGLKYPKKIYIIPVTIYYMIILIKQIGLSYLPILNNIITIVLPLYILTVTLLMFKEGLINKITSFGVYYSIIFVSEAICFLIGMITGSDLAELSSLSITSAFWCIISKCLIILLCYLFFNPGEEALIHKVYKSRDVIPVIIINMVYEIPLCNVVQQQNSQGNTSIVLCFCLSQIVLFSSMGYFYKILKFKDQDIEGLKSNVAQLKNKIILKDKNNKACDNLSQLKHDTEWHLSIIRGLCDTRKYAMINKYINGLYKEYGDDISAFELPDPVVSLLMGSLKKKALDNNIRFEMFCSLTDFYLSGHENCIVINNLVNNAIESTIQLPKRYRQVSVNLFNDIYGNYLVHVSNSAPIGVVKDNFLTTSKKNRDNCGLGIKSVYKIVKRYKGKLELNVFSGLEENVEYDTVAVVARMEVKTSKIKALCTE